MQTKHHFKGHILFHEYFDSEASCESWASQQAGLVAYMIPKADEQAKPVKRSTNTEEAEKKSPRLTQNGSRSSFLPAVRSASA
jgi:hypothetical protein